MANFDSEEIRELLVGALQNVFDTMMSTEITYESKLELLNEGDKVPSPILETDNSIVCGSVGFTGVINGIIYLYLDDDLAKKLTCAFLGFTMEEVEEEGPATVNDALGELTNMSVGDFKNKLCDKGLNCMLTLPSILRGNDITIESSIEGGVSRYIFYFNTCGSKFVADLIIKPQD